MRPLCCICERRKTRGAHDVCEPCWMFHIHDRQNGDCARCHNDVPVGEMKWSKYDVDIGSIGEMVCKRCHNIMARRGELRVNKSGREGAHARVRGGNYHQRMLGAGVPLPAADRIYRELNDGADAYQVERARAGLSVQQAVGAWKRRALARFLARDGFDEAVALLGLRRKKKQTDGRSRQRDGVPVMTEGDRALLGLPPEPPKKSRKRKQKQQAVEGKCGLGFCDYVGELAANGLCPDHAELEI